MTILSGNSSSATRLVEAIAGSSGSIIDPAGATGGLPILGLLDTVQSDVVPTANDGSATGLDAGLLDHALSFLTGSDDQADPTPLPGIALAGDGTPTQPVFDVLNTLIKDDIHAGILEPLTHDLGISDSGHFLTGLGETIGLGTIGDSPAPDGPVNLVTDVLNLPGNILAGNIGGALSDIGTDLSNILNGATNLVQSLVIGSNDSTNPIPEIISSLGHDIQSLPLLNINGGADGGILGGIVGDLSHSSSGHLIDANIGPEQDTGGLPINVLAANETGPSHTLDVNAIDVGPNGPHLAALDLLTGGQSLGGTDSLVGNLLNLGTVADVSHADAGAASALPHVGDIGGIDLSAIVNADHGILNLHGVHLV